MKRIIIVLLCFFALTANSFAADKKLMFGVSKGGKVRVELRHSIRRKSWGFSEPYYKLIVYSKANWPVLFDLDRDKYYILTTKKRTIKLKVDKKTYPRFINPNDEVEVAFSLQDFELMEKAIPDAAMLIMELNRERIRIKLLPIKR